MRFFWTHSYTHASSDGENTLCGQQIIRTHVDNSLWNEVDLENFKLRPCEKCKKKLMKAMNMETVKGEQTTL